jgi:hypothetical protein
LQGLGENRELLFNGYGVSDWADEKVLGLDDSDSYTAI